MRNIAILSLLIAFPWLLSCGKSQSEQNLELTVKPDTSFILPGTSDALCYKNDVVGPRLYYPRVKIKYVGDGDFYPAVIKITFKASQVTYSCTIQENITALFQDESGTAVSTPYFSKDVTYEMRELCAIECGGISVSNESVAFKAVGEFKLIGYSIDEEDNQTPFSARSNIFLQNLN